MSVRIPPTPLTRQAHPKIRVGVSSCLVGNRVRYDGNHKRDRFVVDVLGQAFDLVPVCPEVAIGLGTPRPPIRLLSLAADTRVRGIDDDSLDVTDALAAYARRIARELKDISGYVFKCNSPSCGPRGVKVHTRNGRPRSIGVGIFAREFMAKHSLLPIVDEEHLERSALRDHFIEQVFCYYRWQELLRRGVTRERLRRFHAGHRLTFMVHADSRYRNLAHALGNTDSPLNRLTRSYVCSLMEIFRQRATRNRHARVLGHVMGYLNKHVAVDDRIELRDAIDEYRLRRIPLIVPITLLNRHSRCLPYPELANQVYLMPSPEELRLRYQR
ncbi:MAG: YbgA family protein [Acidiferrobacterales bacterium]